MQPSSRPSGAWPLSAQEVKQPKGISLVVMFSGCYMDTWMNVSLFLQENMVKNSGEQSIMKVVLYQFTPAPSGD